MSEATTVSCIALELTVDTSKINKKISSSTQKLKNDVASSLSGTMNQLQTTMQSAGERLQKTAQNSAEKIVQTATETDSKIQRILSDTERSAKSKAAAISAVYKKEGMNQSDAMKKAWSLINRESKNGAENVKKIFPTISKSAEEMANKTKMLFNGMFKKLAVSAGIAAVANFGKECIETAADVNASNAQLEQTFGQLKGNAEAAMKRVADSSGIVQTRLQGVGTSIYTFAKTTGMDAANALAMMEEALQVTADSAAYYDRSLEDTSESLKSFLKGNYENDAALGLSCTETTRNAAANKLYGTSFINLSEAQKQLTLLQMVKDANKLSGAMGQAAREADGWENVTGNLKEAWKQLLGVIGQPILQTAVNIIQKITLLVQALTNSIKEIFGKSIENKLSSTIQNAADSTGALSGSAAEVTENFEDSTRAAEKLKRVTVGFDQLNILSSSDNDNQSANTAGNTVADNSLAKSIEEVNSKLDSFTKKYKDKFDKICKKLSELWNSKAFQNLRAAFKKFVGNAGQSCLDILGDIAGVLADLATLNLDGLVEDVGNLTGHLIGLGGDAAVTISTALLGEDSAITKWMQSKLDRYKEAVAGYGLAGGIASLIRDNALEALFISNQDPRVRNFLATWWEKCYSVFTESLKKYDLATAFSNLFKYALKTSGPFIESTIVTWGNKIIGAINTFITGLNSLLHTNIKELGKLQLSKSTKQLYNAYGVGESAKVGLAKVSQAINAQIPKFATGGLIKAPTLALVGDNPNAGRDPEVISPLSKLKNMIRDEQTGGSIDASRIIMLLERIYSLIEQQENTYENNIYLDSEKIERQLVKVRKRKARRYGGAY